MAPDQAAGPPPAVVALAASAGGVEALTAVVGGLPADLDAAVLVVLHLAPIGPSVLPAIIGRHSSLPACNPSDGEPLETGHVYVAPPDFHLTVEDGRARLGRGPRQNGNRPAADPLFRSVAAAYGRRGMGIVLSGTLDDGTAGLIAIKAVGGVTVAQDPDEAAFPGMPASAVAHAAPDHVAALRDIPTIITRFVEEVGAMPRHEAGTLHGSPAAAAAPPSEFTCPDCGGTLWVVDEQALHLRCRVGHSYSSESLALGKKDAMEKALWAAIVALEERADLSRRLLRRVGSGAPRSRRHELDIEQSERGASTLRELVDELIGMAERAGTDGPDRVDRAAGR